MRSTRDPLRDQYRNSSNLNARARIHALYSTNQYGWQKWVFDQIHPSETAGILELGCGPGWLWRENVERLAEGCRILLTDSSSGMVSEAEQALRMPSFSFLVVDAQAIPLADGAFHGIVANHMLYHVRDLHRALAEIARVLVGDGVLYAATNGPGHLMELHELAKVLRPPLHFAERRMSESFDLNNAGEILSMHFGEVELRRYEDSLAITQAQPVIDYILSVKRDADQFTAESLGLLEDLVNERVARPSGFHVDKETGLLVCRKPLRSGRGS